MIGKLWVGLFALGVVSASSRADACVTFYEDVNYEGASVSAGIGDNHWIASEWNDRISSLTLDPTCYVEVFQNVEFGGAGWTFSGNTARLPDGWDNTISSYSCKCF
ncbi:peptidase inhibitor family I36 protein [Polyangium sp. y55x31]|uniref:peptidase inhibitor family I36 protein n=1 Tax=Polyangium sp. y55x31 TaxID=3042688 RepID=UPI002482D9B3|nr:peptidase inhibitor family I36 protein [Polyangium sp. y55x31]MDI1483446.1 hypothetical protein [Polyangium sp. y55x31]